MRAAGRRAFPADRDAWCRYRTERRERAGRGSLVLCLAQMNAILDVDPRNLTLRAQPGVVTLAIDEAAARHGLFYPPIQAR